MSNPLVMSAWAPGLIGLAFAGSLYGVALGQSIYYARHFPNDSRLIKFMVLAIFLADIHGPVKIEYLGELEIAQDSPSDPAFKFTSPPGGYLLTAPVNYLITFSRAKLVTAILQLGIGGWYTFVVLRDGTIEFLYTDPFILYGAAVSTLCDILITGAVFKYMRNSDLRRRVNFIQDLAVVFINMGALTCLISITHGSTSFKVLVIVTGWGHLALPSSEASYVNSNLAVLNARWPIRQREERRLEHSIELPTLSRIT
ncbi:hypothetical protein BU15DRAFT_71020 [Melanogaster broomeanus]|nr:hypothetical protein BU15DRAFT_71020 [Melanogaster broomeanus]